MFPLGCGICRSEKLELIERNRAVQQVIDEDNLPEAYIYTKLNKVDHYFDDNFDDYYEEDDDDYYDYMYMFVDREEYDDMMWHIAMWEEYLEEE